MSEKSKRKKRSGINWCLWDYGAAEFDLKYWGGFLSHGIK